MRRTPWTRLVLVALVATAASYAVLLFVESRGLALVGPPWLSGALLLVIAAVVGVLGWNVRQYARGKRPGFDVLLAARTVVLATASAYTGALLVGWYAAQVLVVVGDLDVAGRRDVAITAGVATLAAAALSVVGLVVERWCEVPPPDEDDDGPAGAPATGSAA